MNFATLLKVTFPPCRVREQSSGGALAAILRPVMEVAVDVLGGRLLRGLGALGSVAEGTSQAGAAGSSGASSKSKSKV